MSITWLNSKSPLLLQPSTSLLFLPLTFHSSSASSQTFFFLFYANQLLTQIDIFTFKKKASKQQMTLSFPCSAATQKVRRGKAHTWFTGKRLGCVVAEDDRHSMLFCLPWHPGNVLDVMELSDLKRKERVAAARLLEEHSQRHKQQKWLNYHDALLPCKCKGSLAYKAWQRKTRMWAIIMDI